jgi:uncharacterized protein YdaL
VQNAGNAQIVQVTAAAPGGTGSTLWFLASTATLAYVLVLAVLALALVVLRRRRPANRPPRRRFVLAALTLAPLAVFAVPAGASELCKGPVPAEPQATSHPAERHAGAATGVGVRSTGVRTLVLYDRAGGVDAELAAVKQANLASHFGDWEIRALDAYRPGDARRYAAVLFVGTSTTGVLPPAVLDDVLSGATPVLWAGNGLDQLAERDPAAFARYGLDPSAPTPPPVATVRYKGVDLPRLAVGDRDADVRGVGVSAPATLLATGLPTDGKGAGTPWAVRSGNLTYVAEDPFLYADQDDRYLAYTDLIFDLLDPDRPQRHRALVRLEDVGPRADPANLRAVGEYLYRAGIPFSVATYPVYEDPKGAYSADGQPERVTLADRPEVVDALRYLRRCGGTVVMHGYTHQHGSAPNPYKGVSGEDYEFYAAHVDGRDDVVLDGPVPGDSQSWAAGRISAAAAEFRRAGLHPPRTFEFPHYAASAPDYAAAAAAFGVRYEQAIYFPGLLSGAAPGPGHDENAVVQPFTYPVRDYYGSVLIPENLGNYIPVGFNNRSARTPADLVIAARRNLVVRDGFASFFYHPYLGVPALRETVEGIQAAGYRFVTPAEAVGS